MGGLELDMNIWISSFLVIFMLHNLEEIITIEDWFQQTYPRVINKIPPSIQKELSHYRNITSKQFSIVIFVFSIFVSAFILVAVMTQHYYLFLGVNLFFALNIFTHPLQTFYLRSYTPGVLTSIILLIPYYIFFSFRFYNTDLFTMGSFFAAVIVMILFIPLFLFSHKVGEKWG